MPPHVMTHPSDYRSPLNKCVIRIDDMWYDCTAWRHAHPGGSEIVDKFHDANATDAFYALHSKEAAKKLQSMKGRPATPSEAPLDEVSVKFQAFREKLIREGWFERHWHMDFIFYAIPCLLWGVIGTLLANTHPWIAVAFLGLCMQQAGWGAHDFLHGRGRLCNVLGHFFGCALGGLSPKWWSQKHNGLHHTFPNRKEYDVDIHNEPILHLWLPKNEGEDTVFRKIQHTFYPLVYSLLYVSWRKQSIEYVLQSRDWLERTLLIMNYIWIACLPWKVALGSIILGGFLVAIVVTVNHQAEPMKEPNEKYNFVLDTLSGTRGVACPDPFTNYLYGGLQYQVEHHLFPFMPRYNYAKFRPVLAKWCKENGLPNKLSGIWDITVLNYHTMRNAAVATHGTDKKKK